MTTPANTRPGQITHLAVTHEIRRAHDDSVISAHCCASCVHIAFQRLHLADMMGGENQPGPLEYIEAHVIDVATGERSLFTQALVPLDGIPPAKVESYPPHLFDDLH
jgi:hypothetical protein